MTVRTTEPAFPSLTRGLFALLAGVLTAGCAGGALEAKSGMAKASPSTESRSENLMDRLRHDVDQLIETPFDDIAAVDALLGSQLGPVGSDDQLNVRKADAGAIAGISLRSIELRSAQDDPRHATLLMSVEPSALMMTDAPWPAAVLYPPRPDAPDSNAYWSLQTGGATVIVGLGPDQVHVSYVSISKR